MEFSSSEDTARIAITKISDSIDANSSPPDEKEGMKKVMELAVSSQLGMALVCAKVVVKGESSNVKVLVEEEVETSLNLLRCYTHVLFHPKLRAGMGLLHETGVYHRPVIGLSTTDHSWTLDSANVGINHHFELSAASVGYLRRSFALQELSNVLAKEDSERSKLEKLIVTAIRWLGRGIVDSDNPNKVLHFAAACENLIMGQQMEGEISEKFSRRIAFLIGENPEERKYLYARCKKLYNQRSKVIHSGSTNVNPIDVAGLEMITLRALVKIAQRLEEWSTHQDFVSWFENESFGVTGPNTVPA